MSGRDEDELVTAGIYRRSRNPQNTGWIMTLAGISILGRSAFALVLVGLVTLLLHVYLVFVEEPHLTQVFGPTYRQYRSRTPRYFGIG
jgi:protein-S-isoprenylcysteine O-methyltransferase Ste14